MRPTGSGRSFQDIWKEGITHEIHFMIVAVGITLEY